MARLCGISLKSDEPVCSIGDANHVIDVGVCHSGRVHPVPEHDYRVIDPRDKRVWLIAFGILAAALVLLWGLNAIIQDHSAELQALAESDPAGARRQAAASLRTVLSIITLLNVLVAMFLAWQGVRSLSTGRSPPPGSWIIRGRPVYTGRTALRVGRVLIAAAVLLAVATVVMLWLGWRLTAA